jgi:hypothetical protein
METKNFVIYKEENIKSVDKYKSVLIIMDKKNQLSQFSSIIGSLS